MPLLTLDFSEPVWLIVMLRGNGKCIEKHQEDHKPVEHIGFDSSSTFSSTESIPSTPVAAWRKGNKREKLTMIAGHSNLPRDLKDYFFSRMSVINEFIRRGK